MLSVPAITGSSTTAAHEATAHAATVDTTHLVTTFGPTDNVFVESLAINSHGAMFVSKTVWGTETNYGRLHKVTVTEQKSAFGPRINLGAYGVLTGVAIDRTDRVYVAVAQSGGARPSAVFRVTPTRFVKVATFPAGAWPNGLAFHEGRLYISDFDQGSIWRFRPGDGVVTLTRPWVHSRVLLPAPGEFGGVNGIAFWNDTLFAVNYTRGTLVRIAQGPLGGARTPQVVTRDKRLLTADGIAFDPNGHLWVVCNGTGRWVPEDPRPPHDQYLLLMTRKGAIWDATKDAAWMNYPTMLALGRTPATAHRMFVTNGAFYGGRGSLMSFRLR